MQSVEKPQEDELIEILIFNRNDIEENRIDFRWVHAHEFKYNGEMYDIVKKVDNDKQLILYCINDKKETKLEEELANRVHDNSQNSKQKQSSFHLNIFLSEQAQTEKTNIAYSSELSFNFLSPDNYNSVQLDIPSPPPRLV